VNDGSLTVPNANDHDLMKVLMQEDSIATISVLPCMLAMRGNKVKETDSSRKAKTALSPTVSKNSPVANRSLLLFDNMTTQLVQAEHCALLAHGKGVQGE
jgi:hypothetical protein